MSGRGRFQAHDPIVHNAHTSRPDAGEFLGYDRSRPGWCRVLLYRNSFRTVPIRSIERREARKAVEA